MKNISILSGLVRFVVVYVCVAKGGFEVPKLIKHYAVAELTAVVKRTDMNNNEWNWREGYIGYQGELYIMESLKKYPGKRYLCFTDHGRNWITTGYGEIVVDKTTVSITTPNSIYHFEIITDGGE